MKKATKTKKAMDFLAQYVAKANPDFSVEEIQEAVETAPTTSHALSMQAEAVLLMLEKPARFTMKICRRCEEPFGTNYRYVVYCSDPCRSKALQKETGIPWNPHKSDEERWGGEAPLIIPPAAVKRLLPFAQRLLELAEQAPQNSARPDYLEPYQPQSRIEIPSAVVLLQQQETENPSLPNIQTAENGIDESDSQSKDESQTTPVEQPLLSTGFSQLTVDFPALL